MGCVSICLYLFQLLSTRSYSFHSRVGYSQRFVGRKNHILSKPFHILICFLSFLLPPSIHGGPSSEIWVLLKRNVFLNCNPHNWGSPAVTHSFFFHFLCRGGHHCCHQTAQPLMELAHGAQWLWQVSAFLLCPNSSLCYSDGMLESPLRQAN